MTYVDLAGLTWPQAAAITSRGRALGLLPLGALEQHGPHLPLATDSLIAGFLARELAEAIDLPVLVHPVLPIGVSPNHVNFPGTVSLDPAAYASVLRAIVAGFERTGVREVAIFSGHGGNIPHIAAFAEQWAAEGSTVRVAAYGGFERFFAAMFGGARRAGLEPLLMDIHAGAVETSQMLHAFPEAVRDIAGVEGYTAADDGWFERLRSDGVVALSPSGVLGDAPRATAAAGRAIFDALRCDLVSWLDDAFGVPRRP